MYKVSGITIAGKHTSEFGLKLTDMYISLPPVKRNIIEIPGMSGGIDASEVLTGEPVYGYRENVTFTFKHYADWISFEAAKSKIATWIHGKKLDVIVDSDKAYSYVCRLSVDAKKTSRITSVITLSGYAEPFKKELLTSAEPWEWDSFSFETGVIRELYDIEITADNNMVTIDAGVIPTNPVFVVTESNGLAVVHNDKSYALPVGKTRIPGIKVGSEDVILTFLGTGKLSIDYRVEVL